MSEPEAVGDDPAAVAAALARLLETHDAVLTTGGVSAGDRDAVPGAVAAVGGRIAFHGLPVRPGKPALAAAVEGKLTLGLPGNPLAALCIARRFGIELLRGVAGFQQPEPVLLADVLDRGEPARPPYRFRLVRFVPGAPAGAAELIAGRGSADTVAAATSDGFVQVPPGRRPAGPLPFWGW